MMNVRKKLLLLCMAALLCMHPVFAAAETICTEMWLQVAIYGSNLGDVYEIQRTKPYIAVYFCNDGTVYNSGGSLRTYTVSGSNYQVTGDNQYTVESDVYGYIYSSWYGGSGTTAYDRYILKNSEISFRTEVQAEALSGKFITGEEIRFTASAEGGVGEHTHYIHLFDKPDGYELSNSLEKGLPGTFIFEEPGTYYVYANSLDENNDRSIFGRQLIEIAQGPVTAAKITNFTENRSRYAAGDEYDWTLTANPGEGELTQIADLYRDNEFVSRHEIDGLTGSVRIDEPGSYHLRIRLRDKANGGYSPYYTTRAVTIYPLYSYTVLTAEDGTQTIRLDYLNSARSSVVLPDEYDGYKVSEISSNIFSYARNDLKSVTWTAAAPELPAYALSYCSALETLILPEGVTTLGFESLYCCTSLKYISMPTTMTTISENAFAGCSSLKKLYLTSNVTNVTAKSFNKDMELISVPGSQTAAVLDGLGVEQREPTTYTLPEDLAQIGSEAFLGSPVEMVIIPEGCTVDSRTFTNTPNLHYVQLPESATVAEDAFAGCDVLEFIGQ